MALSGLPVLLSFFSHIDIFLLIFVRLLAFFMMLPVVSGSNIPLSARLSLAVCVAAVVFLSGHVTTVVYDDSIPGYVYLVLVEVLSGILMGFVLFIVFNVVYFAGQLIDYQIGLSMMNVMDPMTQIQVPIVGNLFYLAIMALLVVTGGLHSLIGAFFYSYRILPIGSANILGNGALAWLIVELLLEFLAVGVKISMPIVGSILVIDAALGILVKAVPQMNIFVVGMPIKLLVGLVLLFSVMVPAIQPMYDFLFDTAYRAMIDVILGMSP